MEQESFSEMLQRAEEEKQNAARLPAVNLMLEEVINKIER